MVFFNWATMQMAAKIVYYGPGLCGKTSNLSYIYAKTSPTSRGEMVSLETESDRTLFFDLLPIEVGTIGGFKTRLQLYTVPGQVFYNTTRKLVLKGVDGLVFVADSQRPMREANVESFRSLTENIEELGLVMSDLPLVLQYNKRDLMNILTEEELESDLNPNGEFIFHPASAINGEGVFETLKEITKLTLRKLRRRMASPQAEATAKPARQTPRPTVPAASTQGAPRRAISAASLARAAEEGVIGDSVEGAASGPLSAPPLQPVIPAAPSFHSTADYSQGAVIEPGDEEKPDMPAQPPDEPEFPPPSDAHDAADDTFGEPAFDDGTAPEGGEQTADFDDFTVEDRHDEPADDELTFDHEVEEFEFDEPVSEVDFDAGSENEAIDEEVEYLDPIDADDASAAQPVEVADGPSPDETTSPSLPGLEPENPDFGFDGPEMTDENGSLDVLDEASAIDDEDDEIEFDTSADKAAEIIPPPMKRVHISNQTDILAELDGLRREATEAPTHRSRHTTQTPDLDLDSLLSGGSKRTRDLKRRIEQSLNSNIFSRMRTVQLAFEIQDGEGSTIHTLEPISLPLDDASALEKLVLQLTVDLENIK